MSTWTRPLPWWFVLGAAALLVGPVLVQLYLGYRVGFVLHFGFILLFLLLSDSALTTPGRRRLQKEMLPATVFSVRYDGGSRAVVEELSGQPVPHESALVVVRSARLELWTVARDFTNAGSIELSQLAEAAISVVVGRLGETVAIELADGRAIYLEVRRGVLDRLLRRSPSGRELADLIEQRLTPDSPDTARTPRPARSGS